MAIKQTLALTAALAAWSQASLADESRFFEDSQRGWFWYEEPPAEPEPEVIAAPPPPPLPAATEPQEEMPAPVPSGPPVGSTAWLRDAIPAALDAATDDPTPENVARYFLLQKAAVDKAEVFAEVAGIVSTGHPELDEGRRRPRGDRFAKLIDENTEIARQAVLRDLFTRTAVILFLDKSCSGCALLAENLSRMAQTHGLVWRVVSMDGAILPESFGADTVFDSGIAEELGVTAGGAVFLATPPDRFDPVTWNATAGSEVIDRILNVAYRVGMISEDQFRSTRPVTPRTGTTIATPIDDLPPILKQADDLLVQQTNAQSIRIQEKAQ